MVGFDKFHDLLQQDVTRKEFLRYIGIAVLSLIGVASMLQNLTGVIQPQVQSQDKKQSGYGASAYGR